MTEQAVIARENRIRFTMWLPDDVNLDAVDWSPTPDEELRQKAETLAKQIAENEMTYLRTRAAELLFEILQPKRELDEIRRKTARAVAMRRRWLAEDRRREREVLKLLHIPERD